MSSSAAGISPEQPSLLDLVIAAGLGSLGSDPPADIVDAGLRRYVELVGAGDPLRMASARSEAVRTLKDAGLRAHGQLVDAAFKAARSASAPAGGSGQALAWEDPEPWSDPVDGAVLLEELVRTFSRFLTLPEGAATLLALWTIHTHAHDAFYVSPVLAITSPQKGCGKTTTLDVLSALVARSLPTSNVSAAALFRAIDKFRPTLLIDEADTFLDGKDELRGILNSGHTRSGAFVLRCVGDDADVHRFPTWAPKAIAKIGKLPDTLADRSIHVELQRRTPGETSEIVRGDRLQAELEPLKRRCMRWALDHLEVLREADPLVPPELYNRAADNWRPLLAIADAAGGVWPELARLTASRQAQQRESDDAPAVLLLADVRDLFDRRGSDRMFSADIVAALVQMEERPWPEWSRGRPLTAPTLARQLRTFRIQPKQIRIGEISAKGYLLASFQDAFRCYLPPEAKQAKQSSNGAEDPGLANRNSAPSVSGAALGEKPHGSSVVSVVSGPEGEPTREILLL